MLQSLIIKNFALIKDQTIDFKKGFNVLVGETGAGKSLILDALGFALGDKANKLNLRHGENKMFVQAVFDDISDSVNNALKENGIDCENGENLIFSRSYTLEGKNDCRINGVVVTTNVVKSISSLIVDTYAQNENIELLKVKNHLTILDSYFLDDVLPLKNQIADEIESMNEIKTQMHKIGGDKQNRERELELLNYQIKDIEEANLVVGEDEEIKERINILNNYEKIFDALKMANDGLNNVSLSLYSVKANLDSVSNYDSSLNDFSERVNSAKIDLDDINESITNNLSSMEFDSDELDKLDSRLEDIKLLKKKYGATIEDVLAYLGKIKEDYDNLLFGEEKLLKLSKELGDVRKSLYSKCQVLSDVRKKIAIQIEDKVMQELKLLGFNNAKFKINFAKLPNIDDAVFTLNGLDDVEFLLSANAGQELKSLSKTISGGEMSRFMLALKNVFADSFNTSVLIFDEVDTGISGEIGQKVAERLAVLSKKYQLICITHLCQVTAMADNYIFVRKNVVDGQTYTEISYLEGDDLIKYIAVVSGATPTEVALKFAKELKTKADTFKKNL